jgi:hypothetical protein
VPFDLARTLAPGMVVDSLVEKAEENNKRVRKPQRVAPQRGRSPLGGCMGNHEDGVEGDQTAPRDQGPRCNEIDMRGLGQPGSRRAGVMTPLLRMDRGGRGRKSRPSRFCRGPVPVPWRSRPSRAVRYDTLSVPSGFDSRTATSLTLYGPATIEIFVFISRALQLLNHGVGKRIQATAGR